MQHEVYEHFVIRDQDHDTIRPLDLLQGWAPRGREPLRPRLGRLLAAIGNWLHGMSPEQ